MRFYTCQALAPSTRKVYSAGVSHYLDFCGLHHHKPVPASEQTLAEFVAYLADVVRCAPVTIKGYLSAVRNLHVEQGAGNPFLEATLPDLVYRGVKRVHGTHKRLDRLPITLPLLRKVAAHLRLQSNRKESLMLAAACSLAFFGFLRCGELLALKRADVKVEAHRLTIHIRASKTDPFRQGCTVYVGQATDPGICPVGLIRLHLQSAAFKDDQPLFQASPGRALSRERFVELLQTALSACGVRNAKAYKGHSFRIGAATAAGKAGIPDWLIKTMGRWSSNAYQTYIRTNPKTITDVVARLTR